MSMDKHPMQYLFLTVGLIVLMVFFIWFAHNNLLQLLISGVTSLMFISWGILHHVSEGRTNKTIVVEYILLGVVVFFIAFTVLSIF